MGINNLTLGAPYKRQRQTMEKYITYKFPKRFCMQIGSNAAEQNIPCRTFLGHAFPRARRVTGAWPGRQVKRWIWYETVHFWCKNSLRIALYFGSNLWLLGAAPPDPCSFFIGTKMQEIGPDLPNFRQIVCILKASVHACFDVSDALGWILGGLFFAKISRSDFRRFREVFT